MRRAKVKATICVGRRKQTDSSRNTIGNIADNSGANITSHVPSDIKTDIHEDSISKITSPIEPQARFETSENDNPSIHIEATGKSEVSAKTPVPSDSFQKADSIRLETSVPSGDRISNGRKIEAVLRDRKNDSSITLSDNEEKTTNSKKNTTKETLSLPCDQSSSDLSVNSSVPENVIHQSGLITATSPSKICRSKIKAVPILGHRRTYSISDSEENSKKSSTSRIRTESQSSNISGIQERPFEEPSTQKKSVSNFEVKKKIKKSEGSRKIAEARREFSKKYVDGKPDHKKLTMMDLIFYNPTTNPIKNKKKNSTAEITEANEQTEEIVDNPTEVRDDDSSKEDEDLNKSDDDEDQIIAPRIKIGPTGEIVLDEKSLVIENKKTKKALEAIENSVAIDGDKDRPYGVRKTFKRSKWTQTDTLQFYRALNTIGTDFAQMNELFPKRTRRDLKLKFKKEEKINPNLIDQAIMKPCSFNFEELKSEFEMMEIEALEIERQQNEKKMSKGKQNEKRKKFVKLTQEISNDNTEDTSDFKTEGCVGEKTMKMKRKRKSKLPKHPEKLDIFTALSDSDLDSFEESEESFMLSSTHTTRYGRKTKPRKIDEQNDDWEELVIKKKIRKPNHEIESPKKPGSLMVVSSESSDGQSVVQIYMVTDDKAENCINNVNNTKNLLPIAMIRTGQAEEEIVENNYTIPADTAETVDEQTNGLSKIDGLLGAAEIDRNDTSEK